MMRGESNIDWRSVEVVLDPKTAKLVIGRLPIEKLAALSEMKSVRYVAPQMSR